MKEKHDALEAQRFENMRLREERKTNIRNQYEKVRNDNHNTKEILMKDYRDQKFD